MLILKENLQRPLVVGRSIYPENVKTGQNVQTHVNMLLPFIS